MILVAEIGSFESHQAKFREELRWEVPLPRAFQSLQ